jgi:pyridoxal phosphate enzyme (YggS family)
MTHSISETASLRSRVVLLEQSIEQATAMLPVSTPRPVLIAASKTQPEQVIEAAIALGIRHFGENRVQEAMAKWPSIKARHSDVVLHLIGALQSNKVAEAVALFDVIETIDRVKIVDVLAQEAVRQNRSPICLIQVNTGEEAQKAGVLPQDAGALIAHARARGLKLEGLMCIPPALQHPAPHFALLRQIALDNGLSTLSMGMSEDYREAIRMGATHIRLGTALFGARDSL